MVANKKKSFRKLAATKFVSNPEEVEINEVNNDMGIEENNVVVDVVAVNGANDVIGVDSVDGVVGVDSVNDVVGVDSVNGVDGVDSVNGVDGVKDAVDYNGGKNQIPDEAQLKKRITIRFTEEHHDFLNLIARVSGTSINQFVNDIIEEEMARRKDEVAAFKKLLNKDSKGAKIK